MADDSSHHRKRPLPSGEGTVPAQETVVFGRKSGEAWDWKKAKLSDVEIAELLLVLELRQEQAGFFHKFNGNETRISVGRKEQTLFIRVDDYAAVLNPGQQVVFAFLCQRIIERGCEQAPWQPKQAEGEEEGA